jgi:hypothetical protein
VLIGAYDFSYSFLAIFAVTMIWGFVWSPPMPLYDGVLVNETRKHGLDYARVRMWSSVAFIGGTQSTEVRQVGLAATRALTRARIDWLEGSHLFPMERPDETAAAVLRWLDEVRRAPGVARAVRLQSS